MDTIESRLKNWQKQLKPYLNSAKEKNKILMAYKIQL